MKSIFFSFSFSLFHAASFGFGGHPPPPLHFPSSVCVCTLTHSSLPWSLWSLGLAWGFEVVVKAWGQEEGRGVIMRSSPQLLLPNLPSSPFVLLPFHVHATHLFSSSHITASHLIPSLPYLVSPLLPHSSTPQPLWLSLCPSILASAPISRESSIPGASPQPPPPCPAWPTVNGRQAAWLPQSSRKLQQQGLGLYGAAGWLRQKSCQAKDERPLPVRYWGTK